MSGLKSRLSKLRTYTEAHLGSSSGESLDDTAKFRKTLRDRLGRLSISKAQPPTRQTRLSDKALAKQLGGACASDGLIAIERTVQFGAHHGRCRIGERLEESLAFFGHDDGPVVFMDTETTGLAGGTGTVVFLLGLGRIEKDKLHLAQYFLTGFKGEPALLAHGGNFIRGATTCVSYNGKSFDHPLLATRYRLTGRVDPFGKLSHIDLLHHTRRAFRNYWPDCSLRTAEERMLGLTRVGDLPGSEAPQTWFDWIRHGRTDNLPRVLEHNDLDLLSLVTLLPALKDAYENPHSMNANIRAVSRHYQRYRDEASAFEYLLANRNYLNADAALELAHFARRRKDWELAVETWHQLSEHNNVEAIERLAKYFEHVARDLPLALEFTRRLLQADQKDLRHVHRENRLLAKLAAAVRCRVHAGDLVE